MEPTRTSVDVKRIVALVLVASMMGMVFFVFYVLTSFDAEDGADDTPTWWRGSAYTGAVLDIDETSLTLQPHSGEPRKFRLDANTRFVLRGNSPVTPGVEVKVLYRAIHSGSDTSLVARTVRVLRPSPAPQPDASAASSEAPALSPSGAPSPTASARRGTPSGAPSGAASPVRSTR